MSTLFDTGVEKWANLSPCNLYRYRLGRVWDAGPRVNFVMLNPSTADAIDDDNTIKKCVRYARRWGYGGITVTNLFAWRSTDPDALFAADDPVGPDNDRHISEVAASADLVILGWGAHKSISRRVDHVLGLILAAGKVPHCLAATKDGHPGHPLFLKGSLDPTPFGGARP